MAAQGNQTTYTRPEGESTQWEDIQAKLGNLPARDKPEANKPFEPHAERDNVQNLIEAENADELEQLEDDFADDPFLEQYRELRLKELQAKSSTQKKGIVQKITREQFVSEVTEASRHKNVIVHLYKDKLADSGLMSECLEKLASTYLSTKFVKILSTDCIPGYPDVALPLLLVYQNGKCQHNLQGSLPFGGRLTPEHIANALLKLGAVANEEQADVLSA